VDQKEEKILKGKEESQRPDDKGEVVLYYLPHLSAPLPTIERT